MPKDLPSILRHYEEFVYEQFWSMVEKMPNSLKADVVLRTIARNCAEEMKNKLSQALLEGAEQERKKLGEVIEGMKIEGKDLNRNGIGYNEALSDLLSSLNQGK